MQEHFREVEVKMKEGVSALRAELKQVRTGRASTAILDGVMVDYYGAQTPLNQVANVSVSDATMVMAQPYDPTQIEAIEKAIHASGLSLNPSNDGKVVRIPIPPLTEERRKEMVKLTHDMAERGRNRVRQVRREGNELFKQLEKDKEISEDDEKRGHKEIQMLHDHYIGEIGEILTAKEKDILEV